MADNRPFIISAIVGHMVLNPLDVLKTRFIALNGTKPYCTILDDMVKKEGAQGYYSGLLPSIGASLIHLTAFHVLKRAIIHATLGEEDSINVIESKEINVERISNIKFTQTRSSTAKLLYHSLACGLSGAILSILTTPLQVVKLALQLDTTGKYINAYQAFQGIVSENGITVLFSGLVPAIVGSFISSSARYFLWDTLKEYALKLHELASQKLPNRYTQRLEVYHTRRPPRIKTFATIIAISSLTAYLLSKPFEVTKAKLQIAALNGDNALDGSIGKAMTHVYETGGISGFWRGMIPGATQTVLLATASYLTVMLPDIYHNKS